MMNAHLCACGHAKALHRSKRPHACMVVRGQQCACTAYASAVDCRFCSKGTGICAACDAEIGDCLPPREREALGLSPL